jgi:L-ascorbate metabolism protein UlaG (beta-lactamase superfamily)
MRKRPLAIIAGCLVASVVFIGMAADVELRFSRISPLTNREIALTLTGSNGPNYRIETSSNLSNWNALVTLAGASSSASHTDTAAPYFAERSYRALQLPGVTNLTGDHLVTTNGDVIIHPVNHASFVMSWQGKMIFNDPVGATTLYSTFPKADLILVSHSHSDHFLATTLDGVRSQTAVIIAPTAVYNSMSTSLRAVTTVLTNGASTNVLGIRIEAIPAYNISNSNHPLGVGNGYVLTIGGKRIYIAGDTEDVPAMRALRNIDVAFVPVNRPYTMDVASAANAVRTFRPTVVYPYHYSPSTPATDVNLFKQGVGQDLGIEVRLRKWY